jgi:hypothetical protein
VKQCPYCAEEIQDAAIVCKHCRRDLVVTNVAASRPPPRLWPITLTLAVVLAGIALLPAAPATVGVIFLGAILHAAWIAFCASRGFGYRGAYVAAAVLLVLNGGCWLAIIPSDRETLRMAADPARSAEFAGAKLLLNSGLSFGAIAFAAAFGSLLGAMLYRRPRAMAFAGDRVIEVEQTSAP